jgi:hypothetical protein
MGLPAVGLDDEAVRRPVEVWVEPWVVWGGEREVGLRLGEARLAYERQESGLELAAGQLGLLGRRARQGRSPSVPVRPAQALGDRRVVVELQALGLRQRALEAVGLHGRREVEERSGDGGDRDAVVGGGVLGGEGAGGVQPNATHAVATARRGDVDA